MVHLPALAALHVTWGNYVIGDNPTNSIERYVCLLSFVDWQLRDGRFGLTGDAPRCGYKFALMFMFLYDVQNSGYWPMMTQIHQEYALNIFLDIKRARENHVRNKPNVVWKHIQP